MGTTQALRATAMAALGVVLAGALSGCMEVSGQAHPNPGASTGSVGGPVGLVGAGSQDGVRPSPSRASVRGSAEPSARTSASASATPSPAAGKPAPSASTRPGGGGDGAGRSGGGGLPSPSLSPSPQPSLSPTPSPTPDSPSPSASSKPSTPVTPGSAAS